MRKRRVILLEDDSHVLDVLRLFFEARDYEVVAYRHAVLCPVYDGRLGCDGLPPCGDILLTDNRMPGMSGLEMLRLQESLGCKLNVKNKAVMSGYMEDAEREAVDALGCFRFEKPFTFEELRNWVAECERRIDLTVPLMVKRREPRQRCSVDVALRPADGGDVLQAHAVNCSDSGLCVAVRRCPVVDQTIEICSDMHRLCGRHRVRWTAPLEVGYLAGLSRC